MTQLDKRKCDKCGMLFSEHGVLLVFIRLSDKATITTSSLVDNDGVIETYPDMSGIPSEYTDTRCNYCLNSIHQTLV